MRRLVRPALLVGAVILAGTLGTATLASADEPPVVEGDIVDFDFEWHRPEGGTVPAGTTVTFTNKGDRPHTITDRGGTFDKLVMPGQSASVALTIPGRVSFFCKIRAAAAGSPKGMDATLDVQPTLPAMVNRIQAVDPARAGSGFGFDPEKMTVEAGSTVQLANVGGKPHTLTADDGSFDTGPVAPGAEGGRFAGQNATITVVQPGTYKFHCKSHPDTMRGVLTVQAKPVATMAPVPGSSTPVQGQDAPTAVATDATDAGGTPGLPGGTWTVVFLTGLVGIVIGLASAVTVRRSRQTNRMDDH